MDPFNFTVLLPHESECTKFYACNHGRKILMYCALMDNLGNRLHFNNEIHVCDYPDRAGCKMQSSSTTTNKPTTSTHSSTSNNPTSSTTPKHPSSSSTEASTSHRPMTTTTKKPKSSTDGSSSSETPPMTTTTEQPKSSTEVSTNNTSSTEIVTSSTTEQSAESSTTNEPSTTPTSEGSTAPGETTVTNLPAETTTESSTNPNDVSTINPSTTMTITSSTTEQSTSSTGSSITESTIMTSTSTSESQTSSTEFSPTTSITTTTAELPTTITTTTMKTPTETTQLPSNPTNADITTNEVPTTSGLPMTSSETTLSTTSNEINSSITTTTTEEIETSTIELLSTPTCTNNTTDVYFPHESHSGLYYECRYGDLIRRECKDNLIFDVSQQTCVLPLETNLLLKLTNAQLIDESTSSTMNNVNLCDMNDSNGNCQRYSHESDCTKYYICINGNAVLRMCPSRLNFNSKLKECDLPSNANCNGDNNNLNNTMPNKCPLDNSGWAINLPHETNCSLFYKCNWGEKIKLSCKSGLYFNPTLQVCDYPCAAGCTVEGGSGTNTCHNSTTISGNEEQFKQKPIPSRKTFKNLASIIHNQ